MKKLSIVLAIAFMLISFNAFAGQEAHNWGTVVIEGAAMTINLRNPLTTEKTGPTGRWANKNTGGFKGAMPLASPEAYKALSRIWNTPGVRDGVMATYELFIFRASAFNWPEMEVEIYSAMDAWHVEVTKKASDVPEPKKEKTKE